MSRNCGCSGESKNRCNSRSRSRSRDCKPKCKPKRKPCVVNCPAFDPNPTFNSVTVTEDTTLSAVTTISSELGSLIAVNGTITNLDVVNLDLLLEFVRTQQALTNQSFENLYVNASIPISVLPTPIPWAPLITPSILPWGPFVNGTMVTNGQTGILSINISNTTVLVLPQLMIIQILKNGVLAANIIAQQGVAPNEFGTLSWDVNLYDTDSSVTVSLITTPAAVADISVSIASL